MLPHRMQTRAPGSRTATGWDRVGTLANLRPVQLLTGKRAFLAVVLIPLMITLAACSDSDSVIDDVPTPSAVPTGAVAMAGDSDITGEEFEAALKTGLTGYDPLSPSRVTPEPLDPPRFSRCVAAIESRAAKDPDLKRLGTKAFLGSCRQRYDQLRMLTLSRLIQDRWVRIEAELAGLTVSKQEADAFIRQVRLSWASDPAESRRRFRQAVEASGTSPEELRSRAETAVARQRLGSPGPNESPSAEEIQAASEERFDAWRSRTLCAEELLVPECSNAPESG